MEHNRLDIADRYGLFETDEEIRAGMSSGNGGTGRTRPAGPPQARNPREHRASSFVNDHERKKVPAISHEESPGSTNAADPRLPNPANGGSLEADPAGGDSWTEAAMLLGSVAKMLSPDSSRGEIGRSARADLIRNLDALEVRLRDRADAGFQPTKATPPCLESKPSEGQNTRATTVTDSTGEQKSPGCGCHDPAAPPAVDSSEEKTSTFGDEDRHGLEIRSASSGDAANGASAHQIEIAERFAQAPCRSVTPAGTAVTLGESTHFSTHPPQSVDDATRDALLQQIETAHARLWEQIQAGFAAATIEISALSAAVSSAIEKRGIPSAEEQSQQARAALEQLSEALAQRLDLVASKFASVTVIEKSISELSAHLEEIRQSVAGISTANEQARQNLSGSGTTEQAILDAIASLHALHEDTAKRATLAWTSIQASLEQFASLSARLEAAATRESADRPSTGVDPNDPFLPLLARFAQQGDTAPQLNGTGSARANANASAQRGGQHVVGGMDNSGFQNEFGHGFPGLKENREPPGQATPLPTIVQEREDNPSRSDFIAAARRAARTAQLEGQRSAPAAQRGETPGGKKLASLLSRGNRLFATYRSPIVVGTATLLALIAALALGRLLILDKVRDFLPAFLRPIHSATINKSQASAETGPAANSVNMTTAISPLPPVSPASPANASGKTGAPESAPTASNARVAANLPDSLAPPDGFVSQDSAGGRVKPAPRAIAGSDAIVAAAMQPVKQLPSPGPGTVPAPPAPTVLSPASKAQSHLPLSGSGATLAQVGSDRPPGGTDRDLLARAEAGDPAAQFELAAHYAEDPSTKENLALAALWYDKAAHQGHPVAEYRLASLYEKGHGVAKDIERAKDLYERAAEKGNIRAMHNLGVLAAEGSDRKPNYTSAALWFSKAAGYGIKDSQYNFAVLLARGLGVTKDLVRSYTWFAIVAATGDADAAHKRDEVAARLTSSELAAANAAAAAFVPGTPDSAANEPAPPPSGQEAAKTKAGPTKSKVSGL